MDLKDKILVPTNLQSFSLVPNMLNSSLQVCGLTQVNTGQQPVLASQQPVLASQQPVLIPWSGASVFSGMPMTMMPVLNQSVMAPVNALKPTTDSLILVPVSHGLPHTQSSDLSASTPASVPTLQTLSHGAESRVSRTNNSVVQIPETAHISSLPILSQPSLYPQSLVAANQLSLSSLKTDLNTKLLCPSTTESLPQENKITAYSGKLYPELLNGRCNTRIKRHRTISNGTKGARSVITTTKSGSSSPTTSNQRAENKTEKCFSSGVKLQSDHDQQKSRNSNYKNMLGQLPIDSENISRIISSLPPGWTAVGLTSLDNPNMLMSDAFKKKDLNHISQPPNSVSVSQRQSFQPLSNSSPPDVVSVDLNISSAMSSPVVSNTVSINASNINQCSVILSDSVADRSISVKKEIVETENNVQEETEAISNTNFRKNQTCLGKCELEMHIPSSSALAVPIKTEPEPLISSEAENSETCLETPENQWTVVGVTSLQTPSDTQVNPIPQNLFPNISHIISPKSLANKVILQRDRPPVKSVSPKATTILNVPLPKISHSVKDMSAAPASDPGPLFPKPSTNHSPNLLNSFVENDKQNFSANDNQWTIVGVTVCPSPVKSQTIYSNAETSKQSNSSQVQNLSVTPLELESLKSQLLSQTDDQQISRNFSEAAKAFSAFISKDDTLPDVPISSNLSLSNEWKVVGITQLPNEQNFPANCSQGQNSNVISPASTLPTCTTTVSSSSISCPSVTNTSQPCKASNNVLEYFLKNNLSGKSELLSAFETNTNPQQSQLIQFLNGHLQLQQQQQQQMVQQEEVKKNLTPILSQQNTCTTPQGVKHIHNSFDVLNQFQDLVGVRANRHPDQNIESNQGIGTMSKSQSLVSSTGSVSCSDELQQSQIDLRFQENLKNDLSNVDNKSSNQKSQFVAEKCFGKSDCVSRKAKNMCARCMKKHTVSHLLRMKRTKDKKDCTECDDSGDNFECVGQNLKIVKRLSDKILKRLTHTPRIERDGRLRPLSSYAGNRKMFSRSYTGSRGSTLERISLRSGTKVPVNHYESDCNESEFQSDDAIERTAGNVKKELASEDNDEVVKDETKSDETRSAARKRKLKVPRKMVAADLDYHPFDSSSDSN